MTTAKNTAYKLRKIILTAGLLLTLGGLVWILLPFINDKYDKSFAGLIGTPIGTIFEGENAELFYLINIIIVVGILLLAQWAFLRPSKNFKVNIAQEGRPLRTSIFAAGLSAMMLTVGLVALILELPNWWEPLMDPDERHLQFCVWGSMLAIWGVWTWVFWVYWKQGDRYTQLGKMVRGLVAGSILEIMVAVPVHVWAARQRDCYCCRGTYTTLVFSATVLIWAFGPGVILLYMREKYRRAKLMGVCPKCGGDLNHEKKCNKCDILQTNQ